MDYAIVTFLFFIGFGYFVMRTITKLKRAYPKLGFSDVWKTFFREEWDTILTSLLGLALMLMIIFIPRYNGYTLPDWYENFGMYGLALVDGYAGTKLIYKYMGTAEGILDKKADTIKTQFGVDVTKEPETK